MATNKMHKVLKYKSSLKNCLSEPFICANNLYNTIIWFA